MHLTLAATQVKLFRANCGAWKSSRRRALPCIRASAAAEAEEKRIREMAKHVADHYIQPGSTVGIGTGVAVSRQPCCGAVLFNAAVDWQQRQDSSVCFRNDTLLPVPGQVNYLLEELAHRIDSGTLQVGGESRRFESVTVCEWLP